MISYAINGINGYDDIMIWLSMITRFPNKLIVNSGQFMVPWVAVLAKNGLPGPEALALMPRSRSRRGRVQARQSTSPAATTMRPTTPNLSYMLMVLEQWPTCTWTEDALQGYRSQPTGTDATDPLRLWSTATATATAPLAEREAAATATATATATAAFCPEALVRRPWAESS